MDLTDPDRGLAPWLAAPLADTLRNQRAHATLIHGPAGVGQFELALALAQAWLCEQAASPGTSGLACGQCAGCRLMKSRLHPDLRLLLPDALRDALGWGPDKEAENTAEGGKSKAKPSQEIRVDAVRAAIEWGQQTSTRGIAKVLVVHPAQAMNATAANALLKTLEEPPGLLRLVLVASDPDALLATVRSRCQRVRLTVPPRDQALAWLRAQGIAGAEVLLDAAGGCPLDVPPLIRCGIDDRLWAQLPGRVRQGDATACANWPLPTVVETLQKLCLDLMRLCVGAAPTYFPAAALPLGAHMPELARWSRALADAARHDGHPWHAGLFVEALVLQARDVWPPAGSTAGARTDSGLATLQSR